jgi:LacI family transcriptional regulator
MAAGVLPAARERGLAVPADLSVMGFDDHEVAPALELTTVSQPVTAQAQRAAELLLGLLAGEPAEPRRCLLPTRLVRRATTAAPPPRPRRLGSRRQPLASP